ncbi:energy-coupling factor transporter transmembrane protein EcfT [Thermoactinomyces sp. DSM 45892]|uniref:energy-coupling factor transporter transmembrane component T family protein n=1 Tax=Thermoactinomyces sp. DSM 45892 TaxID=1882753 RepID=UPI00089B08B7|nr:energy-coupling factor transporter transmembrane component T [Thermoactinomyces sp. DSM 45892]SDY59377.1 energy-coupling factor transport system permease protein [Thermoactinomyces sp. DSM 45892]
MEGIARETWLHRVNPSVKLLLSLGVLISLLFIHNLNVMLLLTIVILICFAFGTGVSKKVALLFFLPFFLLFCSSVLTMALYGKGSTLWWEWGIFRVSEESFYRGVHLGFRALTFGLIGLIFVCTTHPVRLFYSLMQQLHFPSKFAYSFMASIRLLPIIWDEFQMIRMAHQVRGFSPGKGWKGFKRKLSAYAVPLLAQSIRRAYRIAVAMEAKRFKGNQKRTYYYKLSLGKWDVLFLLFLVGITGVVWFGSEWVQLLPNQDVRLT